MKEQRLFLPDFLIIPYQLVADQRVDPLDEKVYATIYWLEHMRGGVCNPSNRDIARVVYGHSDGGPRAIQNALTKLENLGYIVREFSDKDKRIRAALHTTVSFRGNASLPIVPKEETASTELAFIESETPKEFAARFFSGDRNAIADIGKSVLEAGGISREDLFSEMKKFTAYWTEPNGSGKKERWELEKTFEVRRRLATWISNATRRQGSGTRRGLDV